MVLTQAGLTIIGLRFAQLLPPVADFRCSARRIAAGKTVDFFDQSSVSPRPTTSWISGVDLLSRG